MGLYVLLLLSSCRGLKFFSQFFGDPHPFESMLWTCLCVMCSLCFCCTWWVLNLRSRLQFFFADLAYGSVAPLIY
jgi:hypothetical protein